MLLESALVCSRAAAAVLTTCEYITDGLESVATGHIWINPARNLMIILQPEAWAYCPSARLRASGHLQHSKDWWNGCNPSCGHMTTCNTT